jgi:oligopeptide/dipeptide ABC transporter ATP-binding protein
MPPLLEARQVRKVFRSSGVFRETTETVAVEDFSMSVSADSRSFVTIAGESGSGKTTIARLLLGLAQPTSGQVLYQGEDIHGLKGKGLRAFRKDVQAIFQDPFEVYNPFYKVDHILMTPIRKFGLADSKPQARELAAGALETVGLRPDETLGRYPHQLSGGQRQRITIARALLLKPRLIIADEPVSMVDASLRATILESLHQLYSDFDISFIYITHDLTTAYQVTDNLVILYHGAVAEAGPVEEIVAEPQHPYTKELIRSIPVPDPAQGWLDEKVAAKEEDEEAADGGGRGCKYAGRCPDVMPGCASKVPALYQTDARRVCACFLYETSPALARNDIATLFANSPPPAPQ